jgi:hypothetical protein
MNFTTSIIINQATNDNLKRFAQLFGDTPDNRSVLFRAAVAIASRLSEEEVVRLVQEDVAGYQTAVYGKPL